MKTKRRHQPEVWISKEECDRLNAHVCDLFLSGAEEDACDAIKRVILIERMSVIEEGDRVELYEMPSGELVTVWWESDFGTSVGITTKEEWDYAAVGFDEDTGLLWESLGRLD